MRRYQGLLFPLSRLCRRDRQVAGLNIVKTACPSGLSRSDWGLTFPLMLHQRKVRTGKGDLLWKAQMGVIL